MIENDKNAARFAVIAGAYSLHAILPFLRVGTASGYFAVPLVGGLICSSIAIAAAVGIFRSAVPWARVAAVLLSLPPLLFLLIMIWGSFGDVKVWRLMH